MSSQFVNKVFTNMLENIRDVQYIDRQNDFREEGIITSVNQFFKRLVEANDIYSKTFSIKDSDKLIFAESLPTEIFHRLNNNVAAISEIEPSTLRDIRIVTYTATEEPGIPGAHTPNGPGTRNIKFRFAEVFEDPEYSGYSIVRLKKDIEATINFHIFGVHYQDIRDRATLLRDMIQNSSWYLLHKGLKNIVWNGSYEAEKWDHQSIAKSKVEKYCVGFTEIIELKEKNIEQISIDFALDRQLQ